MILPNSSPSRIWLLDLHRGLLVILMTLAHTIHFVHDGTHHWLLGIQAFVDFITFSGLIFLSGATAYIAYINQPSTVHVIVKVFRRIFVYLLGYYFVALWVTYVDQGLTFPSTRAILTFQYLPPYTEFIIPFLVLGLLKIPLRQFFRITASSLPLTIITSCLVYIVSLTLSQMNMPFIPLAWKALLVGHSDYMSFPVLSYLPLYLLGLHLGFKINRQKPVIPSLLQAIASLLPIVALLIAYQVTFTNLTLLSFSRWPPNHWFLIGSLFINLIILLFFKLFRELQDNPWTKSLLLITGQNAFAIFFAHTFLMGSYHFFNLPPIPSFIRTLGYWFISFLLSIYLAKIVPLNYSFSLTVIRWCDCQLTYCSHAHEHNLVILLKRLLVKIFNLKQLFSFTIAGHRYYILRKRSILIGLALLAIPVEPLGLAEFDQNLKAQVFQVTGTTDRTWYLTNREDQISYQFSLPADLQPDKVTLLINGQPSDQTLLFQAPNSWQIKLPIDQFKPDKHRLAAQLTFGLNSYTTSPTPFNISYPLLVSWTIDWEGYDAKQEYINAMETIANKHSIPMTQLFNPRVYHTKEVTPERAQYLTDWVIRRRDQYGDEIGLHLHMFPDFIEHIHLTPRLEPVWGGGFSPGYDILTTAYEYHEMVSILEWAKITFQQRGLGTPVSYRAGAWFADETTLQALNDTGFLIDSSGRTPYTFGTNKIVGPWQLETTTQPYHPSIHNQNADLPSPRLKLLEIPNNGADDYAFTAEEMIARFDANFDSQLLKQPRQVTYLSHPQWFIERRQLAMDQVFTHIDQWSYAADKGPVIYATLSQIHQVWTQQESP